MGRRFLNPPPLPEVFTDIGTSFEGSNYVLASWSGSRRKGGEGHEILADHLDNLSRVSHSLAQVVVVVPYNPDEPPLYRKLIRSLPAKVGGARVVLLERANHGMSYGSWGDALAVWAGHYPWHFLMEDDFVFCQDAFDRLCVDHIREAGGGMLNGGLSDDATYGTVSNCVVYDDDVRQVRSKFGGKLPYARGVGYDAENSQSVWGQNFWRCGVRMIDMRDRYGVSFAEEKGVHQLWPHPNGWLMVSRDHWNWLKHDARRVRTGTGEGDGRGGPEAP